MAEPGTTINPQKGTPMTKTETWQTIPGYDNHYQISTMGRVKSLQRTIPHGNNSTRTINEKILRPILGNTGYLQVTLWKNHHRNNKQIHRLVAETFLGPPPQNMEVCHNNGNRTDNHLDNLRYDTKSANAKDRNTHGTNHYKNKTHCPRGHILKAPNLIKSKKQGHRSCLACSRAYHYMRYHNIPETEMKRISDKYFEKIHKPRSDFLKDRSA